MPSALQSIGHTKIQANDGGALPHCRKLSNDKSKYIAMIQSLRKLPRFPVIPLLISTLY